MSNEKLIREIQNDLLSGRIALPFSNKNQALDNGTCYIPKTPNRVEVIGLTDRGKNYRSAKQNQFDTQEQKELVSDFIDYINLPKISNYCLEFEFIQGINGPLPQNGRLDSMIYDKGIKVRPVELSHSYNIDLRIQYNQLQKLISPSVSTTLNDVSLELKDLVYSRPLQTKLSNTKRGYTYSLTEPMLIERWPIWLNVYSPGIERQARLPLEVLSNLLEPYTSTRIATRSQRTIQLLSNDPNQFQNEFSSTINANIEKSLNEEKALSTLLVKRWLIDRRFTNSLSFEEIINWKPYSNITPHNNEFSHNLFRAFDSIKPKGISGFYCSALWEDWINGNLNLNEIDFDNSH